MIDAWISMERRRRGRICAVAWWVVGLAMVGCIDGTLQGPSGSDTGDAGGETPSGCGAVDVDCGPNAVCREGGCVCVEGYERSDDDRCIPEEARLCGARYCVVGSRCIEGTCRCDPDFSRTDDGECVPDEPSSPAGRTSHRICERWTNERVALTDRLWAEIPSETCDTGRLSPRVQRQALRYLNLYRWLAGLPPVTTRVTYIDRAQACATALAAEDAGPVHEIDTSFQCHSPEAEEGARESNIAQGVDHPAESIALYLRDRDSPGLGHRRWLLNPTMGQTGFGQRGRYSCMYAVDPGGDSSRSDVYFPPPGFLPAAAFDGRWSFMSKELEITPVAAVEVTEADTGDRVDVEDVRIAPGDYGGMEALAWRLGELETGTEYRIEITGLGAGGDVERVYRSTLIACSSE